MFFKHAEGEKKIYSNHFLLNTGENLSMTMKKPCPLKICDYSGGAFVTQVLRIHSHCTETCSPIAEHQIRKCHIFFIHWYLQIRF